MVLARREPGGWACVTRSNNQSVRIGSAPFFWGLRAALGVNLLG